ncbi:hypothetical protein [Streptomyces sp. NRRL B-24572]|uniref:hypothetical protein n=1 Tax=Streptomyces sp. NRRL B-24572 TaxID=1962156 RepID=UPI00211B6048|nr:hypothetical protein [Streptomyces sp. NRRL B-24572]
MTTDLPHIHPADDDIEPTAEPRPVPSRQPVVSSSPSSPSSSSSPSSPALDVSSFPDRSAAPPAVSAAPAVTVLPADPESQTASEPRAASESQTASESETVSEPQTVSEASEPPAASEAPADPQSHTTPEPSVHDESGDEAVRTLLETAATERPVEEVATLVARLQETGELSSPADVALRAAAVTRPLGEVRQLLALLNESGYDLHQAETTLRAAAVGRPVEDVVQLVGILGADSSDWQSAGGGGAPQKAEPAGAAPAARARKRGASKGRKSALDGALAAGPGSHVAASPALRSVLRWPAALALFACGLIHMPTDLSGLRSGGDAQALSVVVTVLCLACAVWLAARDTLIAWAAAAGVAVFVIALHGVAGARGGDLLSGSLGTTFAWAKALALLSAVAIVCLAGTAVVRHARAAGAADST